MSAGGLPGFRDKDPFEYNLTLVSSVGRNYLVEGRTGRETGLGLPLTGTAIGLFAPWR